ncbi:MAG: glycosyltransferase [Magnetococcales bacterium]|nr:glycosyltransferase [Magnetococcales bacterium]MBF0110710.1 glycosyltransferase [Magnetococcales bacterium]MBF0117068.1 glycosyltransferase [Magnetococcales bacterium]
MPPLIFYFPYQSVGGVSVLFVLLAGILCKDHEVVLVDLPGGYMKKNLPPGVGFVSVMDLSTLPENALFVTQTCPPWRIANNELLSPELRMFFWNLHPLNMQPNIITFRSRTALGRAIAPFSPVISIFRRMKIKKVLSTFLEHNAIAFMDRENVDTTCRILGREFVPKMLPICTRKPTKYALHSMNEVILCAWLGRIEDFKTHVLLHLIKRLDDIAGLKIQLTIIGSGSGDVQVREAARSLKKLECVFLGTIDYGHMDEILSQQDILFAMGTSALEGAKLGLPTFCLDYSFRHVPGLLRFRMLDEVTGFNLGEEIDERHLEEQSTLETKLREIKQNPEKFGRRCHDYWERFHTPERTAESFIRTATESTLTLGKLRTLNLLEPDPMTRMKSCFRDPDPIAGWQYS